MQVAKNVVLVDGRLVGDGGLRLDPGDPGLLWGHSAFETVRVHRGRAVELPAHLRRLEGSCALLGLEAPAQAAVVPACWAAMAALAQEEAVLRITVTAGGRWIVWARPAPPRRATARCITRPRVLDPHVPAAAKHGNRLRGRLLLTETGADEVIWLSPAGELVEGSWSNVVAVVDGVIFTHPADGSLLPGITRAAVLRLAREQGILTHELALPADAPLTELYLSSSVHGLVPVVELDAAPAPGAGPVGAALMPLLWTRSAG